MTVQDRFDTDIDDLWSAITDPAASPAGWARSRATSVSAASSARTSPWPAGGKGPGGWRRASRRGGCWCRTVDDVNAKKQFIEATLTADGDGTIFVWEERGMPMRLLAPYGAGIQAQVEDLGAYLAGREGADFGTRWSELHPAYEELAVSTVHPGGSDDQR